LPLEVYELIREISVLKAVVLAINLLIVVYLVMTILKSRRSAR